MPVLRSALSLLWPLFLLLAQAGHAADEIRMPDIKITVKGMEARTIGCAAAIKLDYQQRNTVARVNGTLENPSCAASGGSYDIVVTLRDANGEAQTLTFSEPWQRSDATDITFTHDYPVGDNTDLRRVSARSITCSCSGTVE